jgi:hypothetical protein
MLWAMRNSLSEKRDMLLSNKFNEGVNVFIDSAE